MKISTQYHQFILTILALCLVLMGSSVQAEEEVTSVDDLIFPGDPPAHKVVYQFNSADWGYQEHVLFSVSAMLRKYGDNIHIVVVAIGPGIHVLGKKPEREVAGLVKKRVASLAEYGVEFHACGNTMKSLNWTKDDLLPFAKYVDVGAADLMELQEQGYAYINW